MSSEFKVVVEEDSTTPRSWRLYFDAEGDREMGRELRQLATDNRTTVTKVVRQMIRHCLED